MKTALNACSGSSAGRTEEKLLQSNRLPLSLADIGFGSCSDGHSDRTRIYG